MKELKKNFYCGDEVDYDDKCLEQCDRCFDATGVDYGYLQQEAAVINYKKLYEGEPLTQDVPIDAFKQGATWQTERSYSEEDMRGMYNKSCGLIGLGLLDNQTENNSRFKELLEQFKKK